jgi:hypothetical protein
MFANSPNAIRLMNQLYTMNTPPPAPAPRQAPAPRGRAAPKKEVIRHVRDPSTSSSESDRSMSDASTSTYDSYDEPEVIYTKIVKEKKCPQISPAGLASKKTKKEAVKYLKAKGCPDVESLRKPKTESIAQVEPDMKLAPPTVQANILHTKTQAKKAPKKEKVEEVKKEKIAEVKAAVVEEVKAPVVAAAAAEKPKRELTAYQKFVQEQRKTGKSMAEAAAAWKALKA